MASHVRPMTAEWPSMARPYFGNNNGQLWTETQPPVGFWARRRQEQASQARSSTRPMRPVVSPPPPAAAFSSASASTTAACPPPAPSHFRRALLVWLPTIVVLLSPWLLYLCLWLSCMVVSAMFAIAYLQFALLHVPVHSTARSSFFASMPSLIITASSTSAAGATSEQRRVPVSSH